MSDLGPDEIPDTAFNRALQSGVDLAAVIDFAKGEHDESVEVAAYLLYRYDDMFLTVLGERKDYLAKASLLRQHFADQARSDAQP